MNFTGIKPLEDKILIQVDEVHGQTTGGIWLAEQSLEREQMGHDRGVIIDVGNAAFVTWVGTKPQVGDKVIFRKYAGTIIKYRKEGFIGKYRLCIDEDVWATFTEEENNV